MEQFEVVIPMVNFLFVVGDIAGSLAFEAKFFQVSGNVLRDTKVNIPFRVIFRGRLPPSSILLGKSFPFAFSFSFSFTLSFRRIGVPGEVFPRGGGGLIPLLGVSVGWSVPF